MENRRPWNRRFKKQTIALLAVIKKRTGLTDTDFVEKLIFKEAARKSKVWPELAIELEKNPIDYV